MLALLSVISPLVVGSVSWEAVRNRSFGCPFANVWLEHGPEKASEILGMPSHRVSPQNDTVDECSIAEGFPGGAHQHGHSPGYSPNCSATPGEASPYMWPMAVSWDTEETTMSYDTDEPSDLAHNRYWYRFDKNWKRQDTHDSWNPALSHSTVIHRGHQMVFVYWDNETDFKNLSTIKGCSQLDMGGIGNLRPDWFLDSRPTSAEDIQSQYLGNQHIYHRGKALLVKQWRKKDFVNTYFVVSLLEHAKADGIHWPVMLNVPGEGAGPDTLRQIYNHKVIGDSDDHLFLIDQEYVASGGSCPGMFPPSPPPSSWKCSVCQHVYDADKDGDGADFQDLPNEWVCPQCGAPKSAYKHSDSRGEAPAPVPSALDEDKNSWRNIEYTFSPVWVPPSPDYLI